MTEDDAFLSNPSAGFFVYRLAAPHEILGIPKGMFDRFNELDVQVDVMAILETEPAWRACETASYCKIKYYRSMTPVIHYLSPQVVYFDMITSINFDPKSVTNAIEDLQQDEMPFINTKIGESLIDFEDNVDYTTYFHHWRTNQIQGRVGD